MDVDCERRDQHCVNLGDGLRNVRADRLLDPELAFLELSLAGDLNPSQIAAVKSREENADLGQCREQRRGVWFAGQCPIRRDSLPPRQLGDERGVDCGARLARPSLPDECPQDALLVHSEIVPYRSDYRAGMQAVRTAVIPVAGLGTRFLPATKATPKEMLPVVDRPAIEYVVREAVGAGLDDVLFITGRTKRPLEDHFDRNIELEQALEAKGDRAALDVVTESTQLAQIHYVRQGDPRGLGHAVLMAERHVGDHPFAVLLGDDLIDERDPILPRMIDVQAKFGGSVLCVMEVPRDQISLYGCPEVRPTNDPDVLEVMSVVEKPNVEEAPSNYAVIGRYVLDPAIFPILQETPPGRGGEIQLTDALQVLAQAPGGSGVRAVVFRGRRYDVGDRLAYLQAVVTLAAERADLGPPFRAWLAERFGKA
jgi:UTP--glucose-1-phosphate uridylyltransferase